MSLRTADSTGTLADVIDRILDKGLVINADITVSLVGVELLGLRIRAAIASFETAARYGLEFPAGVNRDAPGWKALTDRLCPACGARLPEGALPSLACPTCGWLPGYHGHADGRRLAVHDPEPGANGAVAKTKSGGGI
ncbi:MAG: gas vesicle protein [Chloroflexi bacterium]|nr:gas vesicle protein [Chloroflexota bacterium]